MTPMEALILMESKRPKYVGGVHEDDLVNIMERRQKLIDQGYEVL